MTNDIVESVPSENMSYDNLCQVCYTKEPAYTCPDCKFKTCSNCLRVYLLEYSNLEPHCMNCESRLTFNTIYNTIKPEHFDKYLNNMTKLRFQSEIQKIPECMECCKLYKALCYLKDEVNKLPKFIADILYLISNNSKVKKRELDIYEKILYKCILDIITLVSKQCKNQQLASNDVTTAVDTQNNIQPAIRDNVTGNTIEHDVFNDDTAANEDITNYRIINYNRTTGNIETNKSPTYVTPRQGYYTIYNIVYSRVVHMGVYRNLYHDIKKILREDYGVSLKTIHIQAYMYMHSIKNDIDFIKNYYRSAHNNLRNETESNDSNETKKKTYMFKCSKEGCNGIVNSDFKCDLCYSNYCPKCFAMLSSNEHTCKEDDILTANEIMTNTKPCPKCAARIFKISGCNQMFCTNCKIGFDYVSGRIIKSNFHNPHRMEWLLSRGFTDDNVCGHERITEIKHPFLLFRLYQSNMVREKIRNISNNNNNKYDENMFVRRCKYVLNMCSKKEYVKFIKNTERDRRKDCMLRYIYQEYVDNIDAILYVAHQKELDIIQKLTKEHIDRYMYTFVVNNNLIVVIKELINNDVTLDEFVDALVDYMLNMRLSRYHNIKERMDELKRTLKDVYTYKNIILEFPTFEEEIKLINELVEHTNKMLYYYKRAFNISRVQQLTPLGSMAYMK